MTCHKGNPDCYCKVGFPLDKMCPDCSKDRSPEDTFTYCICPATSKSLWEPRSEPFPRYLANLVVRAPTPEEVKELRELSQELERTSPFREFEPSR